MINPDNIQRIDYDNESLIVFDNEIPECDIEDYDLNDPKDFKAYMKDLKNIVRNSREYRIYIGYLRDNLNMNKCSFFENVSNAESFKIRIELHHYPFTLEDICRIVYEKRLTNREDLSIEQVAKEVVWLHYNTLIGLIPLSETVHELVHNMYLFIPLDTVLGKFRTFDNIYKPYIDPEISDKLERIEEYTRVYIEEQNMHVLKRNYTYVDFSGSYQLPRMNDMLLLMENRVKEIKSNGYRMPTLVDNNNISSAEQYNHDQNKSEIREYITPFEYI